MDLERNITVQIDDRNLLSDTAPREWYVPAHRKFATQTNRGQGRFHLSTVNTCLAPLALIRKCSLRDKRKINENESRCLGEAVAGACNSNQAHELQGEIMRLLDTDRPSLVLGLSDVRQLDSAGIELLLRCVEEAMKRNGDVKLAAPSRMSRCF